MPMASSTQGAKARPAAPRATPAMSESVMAVCTLFLMLWNSPAPTCMATTTLAPMESPTNRFTNMAVTGFTPPMPASEKLLTNCPAMEASAEFSSCCKMLLSARGMANRKILPGKGPLSMSMPLSRLSCLLRLSRPRLLGPMLLSISLTSFSMPCKGVASVSFDMSRCSDSITSES